MEMIGPYGCIRKKFSKAEKAISEALASEGWQELSFTRSDSFFSPPWGQMFRKGDVSVFTRRLDEMFIVEVEGSMDGLLTRTELRWCKKGEFYSYRNAPRGDGRGSNRLPIFDEALELLYAAGLWQEVMSHLRETGGCLDLYEKPRDTDTKVEKFSTSPSGMVLRVKYLAPYMELTGPIYFNEIESLRWSLGEAGFRCEITYINNRLYLWITPREGEFDVDKVWEVIDRKDWLYRNANDEWVEYISDAVRR